MRPKLRQSRRGLRALIGKQKLKERYDQPAWRRPISLSAGRRFLPDPLRTFFASVCWDQRRRFRLVPLPNVSEHQPGCWPDLEH